MRNVSKSSTVLNETSLFISYSMSRSENPTPKEVELTSDDVTLATPLTNEVADVVFDLRFMMGFFSFVYGFMANASKWCKANVPILQWLSQ